MIASSLLDFKQFVAGIAYNDELDKQLGQANALLFACRCEIDKVWATARNRVRKDVKMKTSETGNQLLLNLGLVKPVQVERRDRC